MSPRVHAAFAIVASLVVACTIGWGFVLVGSPGTRRLERMDDQRLRDLQTIVSEIQRMVIREGDRTPKESLPRTLEEAAGRARNETLSLRDPETNEPYVYTVKSETTYELCATFSRSRDKKSSAFWNHPAGPHCFTIDVRNPPNRMPEMYQSWQL